MGNQFDLPHGLQRHTILALNRFGQVVTSSLRLEDVLARIMEQVTELLHPEGVAIIMHAGEGSLKFVAVSGIGAAQLKGKTMPSDTGVAGHVMQTGEAVWLNSQGSNVPGLQIYRQIESISEFHSETLLAVPLKQGGVTFGVLEAAHSRSGILTADDLPILDGAAHWAAIAIANAQLHQQAQDLRDRHATMEERARLARELHDAVTQTLYSMSVLGGAWRRQIESGQMTPQLEHIAELSALAQQALRDVRLLIYELRPTELEEEGLIGALYQRLEMVEQRTGIQARLTVIDEAGRAHQVPTDGRDAMVDFYRLPPALELGLYRIAQEALNNALKHSGATSVMVRIRTGVDCLGMEIEDNGHGFDPHITKGKNGGFGIVGLRERAEQLGGRMNIESSPNQGSIVSITDIPYRIADVEEIVS